MREVGCLLLMMRRPPESTHIATLFPYATLFRSALWRAESALQGADYVLTLARRSQGALGIGPQRPARAAALLRQAQLRQVLQTPDQQGAVPAAAEVAGDLAQVDYTVTGGGGQGAVEAARDRKSTRLNSSH